MKDVRPPEIGDGDAGSIKAVVVRPMVIRSLLL